MVSYVFHVVSGSICRVAHWDRFITMPQRIEAPLSGPEVCIPDTFHAVAAYMPDAFHA